MTRIRFVVLGILAVLAVSAVSVASASAAEWRVEGKALAEGEKKEFSEFLNIVAGKSKIKIKGIVVECNEATFLNKAGEEIEGAEHKATESFIEGKSKAFLAGLQFSGCKVTTPATGCELVGANPDDITVGETEGTLSATAPTVTLKAKSGTFAEFAFGNTAGCKTLRNLTVKVTGETVLEILKAKEMLQGHNLLINEKPSKLKAAGAAVEEFVLEVETEGLESDLAWGTT